MNSNMVKPEKFDHLHLVYHFTVPLNLLSSFEKLESLHKVDNSVINITFLYTRSNIRHFYKPLLKLPFKKFFGVNMDRCVYFNWSLIKE